jgi:hypothetical protein
MHKNPIFETQISLFRFRRISTHTYNIDNYLLRRRMIV